MYKKKRGEKKKMKQDEMKPPILDQETISKLTEYWHKQELIVQIGILSLYILAVFIILLIELIKSYFVPITFIFIGIAMYFMLLLYTHKDNSTKIAREIAGRTCCFDVDNPKTRYKTTFGDKNRAFYCSEHLIEALERFPEQIQSIERIGDRY